MPRIKVVGYIDAEEDFGQIGPDGEEVPHRDLNHETGLTNAGFEWHSDRLSSIGLEDIEFELEA